MPTSSEMEVDTLQAGGGPSSGWKLIQQGAEAKLFYILLCGRPAIMKERLEKTYRHPELDFKLRKRRMVQEVRCIAKARQAGVDAPSVLMVDQNSMRIFMEFVQGPSVKEFLRQQKGDYSSESFELAGKIGRGIAHLHDANIVHGDLTTSNLIYREDSKSVVFIDFGLASSSVTLAEDKAVDLYVLERAFMSTHTDSDSLVKEILTQYEQTSKNAKSVMERLEKVRMRGRKRTMVG